MKISTKLLLGFGLLLAVFAVATLVTWRNLSALQDESDYMERAVVPSMAISSQTEEQVYEFFLDVYAMRLLDDENTFQDANSTRDEAQKKLDAAASLLGTYPNLDAMKHTANSVAPAFKNYVQTFEATKNAMRRKNASFKTAGAAGAELASLSAQLVQDLFAYAKELARGNELTDRHVDLIDQAQNITTDLMTLRYTLLRSIANRDVSTINATLDDVSSKIGNTVQTLKNEFTVTTFQNQTTQILEKLAAYRKIMSTFVDDFTALEKTHANRAPLLAALNKETSTASAMGQDQVGVFAKATIQSLTSCVMLLFTAAGSAILLGIVTAILLSRSITKPLSTIVTLAQRAGGGDLTIGKKDFHYAGKDELGVLVDSLADMIGSQEATLQQVVTVADNLTGSAGNLSAISEETNASMEEVKASVDQVSSLSESNGAALQQCNAGVEEMSAGADTVAQSATDSAAFISQTTDVSNKAINTVNSVIKGMHNVDTNAKETEHKTKQLIGSVENVSSFVSVITGIADQTNLLALNAAIEAARAGEVGRGFAVVAEEVRKLAEESARAAQNVNGIIVELQNNAQESIKATTEAGRMLAETLTQAEQAQTDLNSALKEMNKANDSIQNIAAVAQEQAASSKEVATAIDSATKSTMDVVETISNIRRATDETAQAAQGVAEQSQAVSEHAQTLTDILSRFTLNVDATAAKGPPKGQKALKFK
jgi:methyl-accepting chemotaxis protein